MKSNINPTTNGIDMRIALVTIEIFLSLFKYWPLDLSVVISFQQRFGEFLVSFVASERPKACSELTGSRKKQLQLSKSAITAVPLAITWLHVGMPLGTGLRAEMLPANPD
ncbi:hypothetical protein MITS9509_01017 [Synechococcus sp. MIT S9509]|nr:hypothetical protein MITS9509_01017 [Synechococcus sp. MIT S9509]